MSRIKFKDIFNVICLLFLCFYLTLDIQTEKDIEKISVKKAIECIENQDYSNIYRGRNTKSIYIQYKTEKSDSSVRAKNYRRVQNVNKVKNLIESKNIKVLSYNKLKEEFSLERDTDKLLYSFAIFVFTILVIMNIFNFLVNAIAETDTNKNIEQLNRIQSYIKDRLPAESSEEYEENCEIESSEQTGNTKKFSDVAGLDEVKKDMLSILDFIANRKKYEKAGAKLPKGIILYGPPGTGKTLLAKALANEANVPFLYASGSSFVEKYVGVGAKRVRELFKEAKQKSPCIIFIDELDSIGINRKNDITSEDRKTLNELLTQMDGFKTQDDIIVIGATNRLEDLDSALTRPGRFTDKFCVPIPETDSERLEVIKMYIKDKKLADNINLDQLSRETVGFSPAKIESLLNEAAIISVQDNCKYIKKEHLDSALYKVELNGHIKENQSERDDSEIELVAWHEAGHALVGYLSGKDITKVTVLSGTSGAGGVTFSIPKKKNLLSVDDLKNEVKELYAGRCAEYIYYNEDKSKVTTGASNDIDRATDYIRSITLNLGMESFGLLNLEKIGVDNKPLMDKQIELAKQLEEETLNILKENKDKLEEIAKQLIKNKTIHKEDMDIIMNK